MRLQTSIEGRFVLLAVTLSVASLLAALGFAWWFNSLLDGLLLGLLLAVVLNVFAVRRFMRRTNRILTALDDGMASFQDGDFSVSLNAGRDDELGRLVSHYNATGERLREERQSLYQRELMLDTVIQSTPWALVLINANGRVVYCNVAARQLFHGGRRFEGHAFTDILKEAPQALQDAVKRGRDGMFSVRRDHDEDDIYYLSREHFTLNAQQHSLHIFKQLTRELNRQEVAIWKKVIRVLSHELNNSLAPITSLAHSGRIMARQPEPAKIESVFATIEERAQHLKSFIDGYGRFAKLPAPRIEEVEWRGFVASLAGLAPFVLEGALPETTARFDAIQMQQVLINLLKNAHESGSTAEAVTLTARQAPGELRIDVADAGPGMSPDVLEQALLPFYSTKQSGTGLGLPLCREIVEAHGGRLSLANRDAGGLIVSVWLPQNQA